LSTLLAVTGGNATTLSGAALLAQTIQAVVGTNPDDGTPSSIGINLVAQATQALSVCFTN
jgi:hypothetical protein